MIAPLLTANIDDEWQVAGCAAVDLPTFRQVVADGLTPGHFEDETAAAAFGTYRNVLDRLDDEPSVSSHDLAVHTGLTPDQADAVTQRAVRECPSSANVRTLARRMLVRRSQDALERALEDPATLTKADGLDRFQRALETHRSILTGGRREGWFGESCETLHDILTTNPPNPIESLDDRGFLVVGGTTLLVGPFKSGKSLVATGVALDVAMGDGGDFLGSEVYPDTPSGVLMVVGEGGRQTLFERVPKMVSGGLDEDEARRVHVFTRAAGDERLSLLNEDHVRQIFERAAALGCRLVVIDPWDRFVQYGPEDDPLLGPQRIIDNLDRYGEDARCATLVVHHDNKGGGADSTSGVSGGRGSGKLADAATNILNLKVTNHRERKFEVQGVVRHGAQPLATSVQINGETLRVEVDEEATAQARASREERRTRRRAPVQRIEDFVLPVLRAHPGDRLTAEAIRARAVKLHDASEALTAAQIRDALNPDRRSAYGIEFRQSGSHGPATYWVPGEPSETQTSLPIGGAR